MSQTIKVKAGELSGVALDWAVDAAETGDPMRVEYKKDGSGVWMLFDKQDMGYPEGPPKSSSDWALAGPIIERERHCEITSCCGGEGWYVRGRHRPCDGDQYYGETLLIAAMRCYVASKLGEEIEVPAELVEGGAA